MDDALVLTLDSAYFRLTGGIERWLYRLVRKHGGRQPRGWGFDLCYLHAKSGSLQRYRDFAPHLRTLARRQALPGYRLAREAGSPAIELPDLFTDAVEEPVGNARMDSGDYRRKAGVPTAAKDGLAEASTDQGGKVIALLNQKGGSGKTTLATHLAGKLAMQGQRVTLLDADPQGSGPGLGAAAPAKRPETAIRGLRAGEGHPLHREVPEIAQQADYVVIDGPLRVVALARSALLAADLVLIPVQPSAYDVWATQEMVGLIQEAQVFRPGLSAAFVINRRVVGTVIGREARAALADQPSPTLRADIAQRIAFADCVAVGKLVWEVAPSGTAAREIAAFAQAVQEALR